MSEEKQKKQQPEKHGKRWIGCSVEEQYFGHHRKEDKAHRKETKAKDRSKYKKTDKDKYQKSIDQDRQAKMSGETFLEGRVLSIIPQGIVVAWEGQEIVCALRGLLKKEKTQYKNLITVGDFVLFQKSGDEGVIAQVQPRRSILSRADNLSRRKEQLIAANIDQVLITISVVNPQLKPPLVDRYIIATQRGGMEPIIIVNKVDLIDDALHPEIDPVLREQETALLEDFLIAYQIAGIPVIPISAETGEGIDRLREVMKDKASVFSGQSGVGKSSLINMMTGLDLRVGETVERTKKGSHTTTTTQLIPLAFGGWCIDTPGIKSFGVWDLKKDDVEAYFPEIHAAGAECKFPDCTHAHEADCAVHQAIEEGKISLLRFASYQALRQSASAEHVRR